MKILELLGFQSKDETSPTGSTATVRRIVRNLEQLDPERARFLAAFAYLLSRVANADLDISDEETARMEKIVRQFGELPEDQAILVVEIAKSQTRLFGGTENFKVAREFRNLSEPKQRLDLLHCLFEVSAADGSISGAEEQQVHLIADEIGFTRQQYVDVRSRFSQHRSVIKRAKNLAD